MKNKSIASLSVNVRKSSGDLEEFSFKKLKRSLVNSGATEEDISWIVEDIGENCYDGVSSQEIYQRAFKHLKKLNRTYASKYSLKRAILDLGPSGYPFERLVAALLKNKGYKTEVSVNLEGACVSHEVDVLAVKGDEAFAIECKFHSNQNYFSNVKVPLYINSRFLDIQSKWNQNQQERPFLKQGWLVTNTRFSEDAIQYAECVGLTLLSWNYPKDAGLSQNVNEYSLYPITTLTTITKREKDMLIEQDIILTKELLNQSEILRKIGISEIRLIRIMTEVRKLCNV